MIENVSFLSSQTICNTVEMNPCKTLLFHNNILTRFLLFTKEKNFMEKKVRIITFRF